MRACVHACVHSFIRSLTHIHFFITETCYEALCWTLEIHKQHTVLSSPHLTPRTVQLREEATCEMKLSTRCATPLLGGHKYISKHRILLKEVALSLSATPHATSSRQTSVGSSQPKAKLLVQRSHSTGLTS